jgi:AcrR family transcriptional regulator
VALVAFANHGCFRMTLDDLAARLGIAKGTLYLHYASWEVLLTAVQFAS